MTMMTADSAARGMPPSQRKKKPLATSNAAALIRTDSDERAPKVRLVTLAPILVPPVMPPKHPAATLAMPSWRSTRLPSRRASPAAMTSFVQSSASIEAMIASASALPKMVGVSSSRSPLRFRFVKWVKTVDPIGARSPLAMTGPRCRRGRPNERDNTARNRPQCRPRWAALSARACARSTWRQM
jgi:hypothetical protein